MLKVFIVEDEPLIRESLRQTLITFRPQFPIEYCGEAGDGEIALSMIQEVKPDILFTDIRMPFMDGLSLAKYAKKILPWLNVVIITGFEEIGYTKEAISIGVDGYITKPIQNNELAEILSKIIEQRRRIAVAQKDPDKQSLLLNQEFYREHFLSKLKANAYHADEIYQREPRLNCTFVGQSYSIIHGKVQPKAPTKHLYLELLSRYSTLFESDHHVLLTAYDDFHITAIITGADMQQVLNKAYYVADILTYELKKMAIDEFTIFIGPQTNRISNLGTILEQSETFSQQKVTKKNAIIEIDELNTPDHQLIDLTQLNSLLGQRTLSIDYFIKICEQNWQVFERQDEQKQYRFQLLNYLIAKIGEHKPSTPTFTSEYSTSHIETLAEKEDLTKLTIRLFLNELKQIVRSPQSNMTHGEYLIAQAIDYMKKNFANPDLSLQVMSDRLGISPAYLSTLFSQNESITFIDYLINLRLEKSKRLLETTNEKIIDITFDVGYNDPNYFSYIFKKKNGISPKEYRNQTHHSQ